MSKWILVLYLVVLAGCDSSPPPWEELRAGETAQVYACGGWPTKQVGQIKLAVADINANVRHESGKPFLAYAGEWPGLYGDVGSDDHPGRCFWWIHDNYPTAAGKAKWDNADENGEYGLYDGDSVYGFMPVDPPPGQFTVWLVQGLAAHEVGHAIGADHISHGPAVMDPKSMSQTITISDVQEICDHEVPCDRDYPATSSSRVVPPPQVAEETAGVILSGCGTE